MKSIVLILSSLSLLTSASYAQDSIATSDESSAGFAVRASTLGLGGEFTYPIGKKVNLRAGLYGFTHDRVETADNIDYDLKANLFNAGVMMDYYPWAGIFHLSTGVFYSNNKVDAEGQSGQNFEIGDRIYTPDEVGTMYGTVKANKVAPYAGFGWGKTTSGEGRVKFLFDVGVLLHGTPKVVLNSDIPADSPLNLDPAQRAEFDANLDKEIAAFQDDISSYKIYPVVSFGVGFKF